MADFQLWRACDLDLGSKLFVDNRMDGFMDRHLRLALLGRLCRRVDVIMPVKTLHMRLPSSWVTKIQHTQWGPLQGSSTPFVTFWAWET